MPVQNLGAMMDWENGTLNQDETIKLFQGLVDSGLAWRLQGMYGRQAQRMLDAGLIHRPYNFRVDDTMLDEDETVSGFRALTRHGER